MLRKTEGKRRRGRQRMRYHHRLIGHEFEQTPGDSEGQEAWHDEVHGAAESWT